MKQRTLGKTGIRVSEIGFGAWSIGGGWGPRDDQEAIECLQKAFDKGITHFDTALGYGNGHSEELIGKALGSHRSEITVSTKVPTKTGLWPALSDESIEDVFPTDYIIECTETSLRNLGMDYVDVQQLHAWTPSWVKEDAWLEAANKLKEQGKIRAFGVSANDWDPYGPVTLIESGLIDTVQVIYNIFEQRPSEKLLPAAIAHGVGVIVRVPFEEGLLTGKFRAGHQFADGDWRASWMTPERLEEAEPHILQVEKALSNRAPDMATLALKFILDHPAVSTVIPGMRRIAHVEANAAASGEPRLSAEDLTRLYASKWYHGWTYPWDRRNA